MFAFNFTKMTSAMWKDVFCHQECACLTPVLGGHATSYSRHVISEWKERMGSPDCILYPVPSAISGAL